VRLWWSASISAVLGMSMTWPVGANQAAAPPWPSLSELPVRLEIIEPITQSEIDRYEEMLNLSEAQSRYMQTAFADDYLTAIAAVEAKHGPDLANMGRRFEGDLPESPQFAPFFAAFRQAEEA